MIMMRMFLNVFFAEIQKIHCVGNTCFSNFGNGFVVLNEERTFYLTRFFSFSFSRFFSLEV